MSEALEDGLASLPSIGHFDLPSFAASDGGCGGDSDDPGDYSNCTGGGACGGGASGCKLVSTDPDHHLNTVTTQLPRVRAIAGPLHHHNNNHSNHHHSSSSNPSRGSSSAAITTTTTFRSGGCGSSANSTTSTTYPVIGNTVYKAKAGLGGGAGGSGSGTTTDGYFTKKRCGGISSGCVSTTPTTIQYNLMTNNHSNCSSSNNNVNKITTTTINNGLPAGGSGSVGGSGGGSSPPLTTTTTTTTKNGNRITIQHLLTNNSSSSNGNNNITGTTLNCNQHQQQQALVVGINGTVSINGSNNSGSNAAAAACSTSTITTHHSNLSAGTILAANGGAIKNYRARIAKKPYGVGVLKVVRSDNITRSVEQFDRLINTVTPNKYYPLKATSTSSTINGDISNTSQIQHLRRQHHNHLSSSVGTLSPHSTTHNHHVASLFSTSNTNNTKTTMNNCNNNVCNNLFSDNSTELLAEALTDVGFDATTIKSELESYDETPQPDSSFMASSTLPSSSLSLLTTTSRRTSCIDEVIGGNVKDETDVGEDLLNETLPRPPCLSWMVWIQLRL